MSLGTIILQPLRTSNISCIEGLQGTLMSDMRNDLHKPYKLLLPESTDIWSSEIYILGVHLTSRQKGVINTIPSQHCNWPKYESLRLGGPPCYTKQKSLFFFFLHILHLVGYPHTPSGLKKNNINSTVNTSLIRMTLGLVEAYLTESGPHKGRYILHAYVGFSLFCHLRNHFSPGMKANDTHQSTTYHTQHADVNSV